MTKSKGIYNRLDEHDMDNICLLKDKGFSTRKIMDITGKSEETIRRFFLARTKLLNGNVAEANYLSKRHIDYWIKKLDIVNPEDVHKEEKPFDETEKLRAEKAYQDEVSRYLLNNGERLVNTGNLLTSIGEQLKDLSKVLNGEKSLNQVSINGKPLITEKQKAYIIALASELNEPISIQDIKTYEQGDAEIKRLKKIKEDDAKGWFESFLNKLGGKENE